ncbi:MAG: cytochrome c oxidase subunit I, partial [Hymenobacter sp.]
MDATSPSSGPHAANTTTGLGNSSPAQTGRGSQVPTAELGDLHHHGLADQEDHAQNWLEKYVFSQDHKTIAKQFLITGMAWAFIGGALSSIMRLQLGWPEAQYHWLEPFLGKWVVGGKLDPEFYLALVTMHGTIMVFFVLTAGLSGTFSNFLIPLQIGARDMASGFMNMLSYWFFFLASVIMLTALFVETGPPATGWTVYPPLSALPQAISGAGAGMTLWIASMICFIVSQLLGGVNYISTVINLRTRGMSMSKMPLTIWAFFLTAVLGVLAFPVLFAAVLLLLFDRSFGTSFYLSDIYIAGQALHHQGGSPVLYQHLFWFLGHPEVYIVIMPAMGLVSEIMATNARKPIFGYRAMIGSLLGITLLSFVVWGHH